MAATTEYTFTFGIAYSQATNSALEVVPYVVSYQGCVYGIYGMMI